MMEWIITRGNRSAVLHWEFGPSLDEVHQEFQKEVVRDQFSSNCGTVLHRENI